MNRRLPLALFSTLPLLCGCAEVFYARTPVGVLSGKLDVEWTEANQFIFRPRPDNPLTFVTSAGRRIQPGVMYTDGGSVPRFFWSMPSFGPWDFGPAYILHDWLFQQHHCKLGDWQKDTLGTTADVLAEAIKTQMTRTNQHDAFAVWAIHRAVSSSVAQKRWDSGTCMPPPVSGARAVRIMTIDADAIRP
ncbi:DUF1353 domain-containing protein [Methylibium rhizosphaerae]|uniref:DUF1353 domain-containing protein n=1 Tax=Methylibium rhizosphaerae TaxID=2570323 RepID=UPI00112C26E4|nr:DUF1353 domain-containing protein [Methylibium rhizosphaerae]